jgi:hypothetical protein
MPFVFFGHVIDRDQVYEKNQLKTNMKNFIGLINWNSTQYVRPFRLTLSKFMCIIKLHKNISYGCK